MSEAHRKWKIEMMRGIIAATPPVFANEHLTKESAEWIQDMINDGLMTAQIQRDGSCFPNGFVNLIVTPSGKEAIRKYEADTTFCGIWREYHRAILVWIITLAGTLIAGIIIGRYGFPSK